VSTSLRAVKVTKVDVVGIDISTWLNGELCSSFTVVDVTAFSSVGNKTIEGDKLLVQITGVSAGLSELHFEYSTSTGRIDCFVLNVNIVEDC
jgi:hypothetical protein